MKHHTPNTCYQCNSPLILVSKVTEQLEGSRYPQTRTIYKCSNQECQDEKDREAVKRKQLRDEKAIQTQQRLEKIAEGKKLNLLAKAEAEKA